MIKTDKADRQMTDELYALLASLQTAADVRALFTDLCTEKEVERMAQRVRAATLLQEGKTYQQVIEETDISPTTLSRVSRCLQYGDGYSRFLKG